MAKKQVQRVKFNEVMFAEMLMKVSGALIDQYSDQDYTQTEITDNAARAIANHLKFSNLHLNQLLEFRVRIENVLKRKYNVEMAAGVEAFCQDQEAVLKQHNVPQKARVFHGLLDTLIAVVAMRVGVLEVAVA
jgi:hypothetical protein